MNELIAEAKKVIDQHGSEQHKVAAVMRSRDGRLFTGVSVQSQKMHLCSEWPIFSEALMADADIEMAVAVRKKNGEYIIYPPCGFCRELYMTYFPEANIIVDESTCIKASELLPYMWKK